MARQGRQTRVWFVLLYLSPNIAGAFGLRFLAQDNQAGRLVCYYLTGPYNAAFVIILSITIANTAGMIPNTVTVLTFEHFTEHAFYFRPYQESRYKCCALSWVLYWQHCRPILLPRAARASISTRHLEHDCLTFDRGMYRASTSIFAK